MRSVMVFWFVFGIPAGACADDGLPSEVLDRIRGATVFVKTSRGALQRTGSGFLFRTDGTTGFVATNAHVVAPFPGDEQRPTAVKLIFNSGQKGELSADGGVVAVDEEADLAIVRVSGIKTLPKPLDIGEGAELRETMSVYTAGFPFGDALSLTKGAPAVSFNRGSVSSLRKNESGELAQIQLESTLNPGSSGGPVVDKNGRLVGIAVARITAAHISIAVPSSALARVLEGRPHRVSLRVKKVTDGAAEVEVTVRLVDPLNKISKVSVRVARNDSFEEFKKDKAGKWPPLKGGELTELKVDDQIATGTVVLKSSEKSVVHFAFQPVFAQADKIQIHDAPSAPLRIDYRSNTAANLPTSPFRSKAIEITSKASGDWIFKEVQRSTRFFTDGDFVLADVPKELVGGTLLLRKSTESKEWLEPNTISALTDGSVYAVVRWKRSGKEEVSEAILAKLEREGWSEVKGAFETTFPDGEDWCWIALQRTVKKGGIVLQLKTVRWPGAPVLFIFKEAK